MPIKSKYVGRRYGFYEVISCQKDNTRIKSSLYTIRHIISNKTFQITNKQLLRIDKGLTSMTNIIHHRLKNSYKIERFTNDY